MPDFLRAPSSQRQPLTRGIIQTQPQERPQVSNDDFMRSIGSILSNSNMGMGVAAGADDADEEEEEGGDEGEGRGSDIAVTAGQTINAPFPMSHATGRVARFGGGGVVPRTFIIRNGNVEEQRIVMREAMEEEASGTV